MSRRPVIAVVGSGRDIPAAVSVARDLGRLIAESGWILISGGRNAGVMKAANEAARAAGGLTIGILPDFRAQISDGVDVAIITDMGQARNNIIVLSADVVVACGVDGAGTASEISLAVKQDKPVILIGANDEAGQFFSHIGPDQISTVNTPVEAMELIRAILER